MRKPALIVSSLLLAFPMLHPASAFAQSVVLTAQGGRVIFVWKSKDASSEELNLIQAGVQKTKPELLVELMSCIVPDGTKAVVTSGGFVTDDIEIVEGENAGCRGNIPVEYVK